MPPRKKQTVTEVANDVLMCVNHAGTAAVHVTDGVLHQAIALCEVCIQRIGEHIRER